MRIHSILFGGDSCLVCFTHAFHTKRCRILFANTFASQHITLKSFFVIQTTVEEYSKILDQDFNKKSGQTTETPFNEHMAKNLN